MKIGFIYTKKVQYSNYQIIWGGRGQNKRESSMDNYNFNERTVWPWIKIMIFFLCDLWLFCIASYFFQVWIKCSFSKVQLWNNFFHTESPACFIFKFGKRGRKPWGQSEDSYSHEQSEKYGESNMLQFPIYVTK